MERLPVKRHLEGGQQSEYIVNKQIKCQENETYVVRVEESDKTVFTLDLVITQKNFLHLEILLRVTAADERRELKKIVFQNRYSNIVELILENSPATLTPGLTYTRTMYVEKCSLDE
ncbi:hypothetical protein QKQ25_gp066 [Hyphantria cunea granulovirus]|uniref:Uncharacterized protein n=1 Tax=Hyphantria cunea granulovirus TaxID=307448 RepID=A0AAF1D285_9BBAC|nr:hypothetical protein QKQ25_gp066 [Hyphantria cunea granulovirus]QBQ01619.1 hypothetical protein HycuGV_00066 [Hyphantria cunea granulovirus]